MGWLDSEKVQRAFQMLLLQLQRVRKQREGLALAEYSHVQYRQDQMKKWKMRKKKQKIMELERQNQWVEEMQSSLVAVSQEGEEGEEEEKERRILMHLTHEERQEKQELLQRRLPFQFSSQ